MKPVDTKKTENGMQFAELQFLRSKVKTLEAKVDTLKSAEPQATVVKAAVEHPDTTKLVQTKMVLVKLLVATENTLLDAQGKTTVRPGSDMDKAMKAAAALVRPTRS